MIPKFDMIRTCKFGDVTAEGLWRFCYLDVNLICLTDFYNFPTVDLVSKSVTCQARA